MVIMGGAAQSARTAMLRMVLPHIPEAHRQRCCFFAGGFVFLSAPGTLHTNSRPTQILSNSPKLSQTLPLTEPVANPRHLQNSTPLCFFVGTGNTAYQLSPT